MLSEEFEALVIGSSIASGCWNLILWSDRDASRIKSVRVSAADLIGSQSARPDAKLKEKKNDVRSLEYERKAQ